MLSADTQQKVQTAHRRQHEATAAPMGLLDEKVAFVFFGRTAPAGVSADPQPQVHFPPIVSSQPPVKQRPRRIYGAVLQPRPGESVEEQAEKRLEEPAPEVCVVAARASFAQVPGAGDQGPGAQTLRAKHI